MPEQQEINYVQNNYADERSITKEHSPRWRVLHSILIIIGVLILLLAVSLTGFVRHQMKYRSITKALQNEVRLSDADVPGEHMTVAEYIRKEYVKDDRVQLEDVAEAVDCMEVPAFIADKLSAWGDMLRGTTDTVPGVTEQDIIKLLEDHEHDLYRKCMLVIEDRDKKDISSQLEGPLSTVNGIFSGAYGSAAMRALARFRVKGWMVLLEIALLALLLWRWTNVYANSGERKRGAFKAMGRTLMIAGALVFLACAVTGIMGAFTKDGVIGLNPLWKAIREPFWISSMLTISAGAVLIIIAQLLDIHDLKKLRAASAPQAAPSRQSRQASVPAPVTASGTKFCIYCGKGIPANAAFCSFCGKRLDGGSSPAPVDDTPAPAPIEETPAPAAPVAPEVPAEPEIPAETTVTEIPAEPEVPEVPASDSDSTEF